MLALGACGNSVTSLRYTPTTFVTVVNAPVIGSVEAVDRRREDARRLATIMGGFGNTLKTLDTTRPVKDEVVGAFVAALRLRGLLAQTGQGKYRLAITIHKFNADMVLSRTARIDLTMSLLDRDGRVVFQTDFGDSESDMKVIATGILADIGDLKILAEDVLDRTVDRMLDAAPFRAALTGASASVIN